jgi:hypothetical protein
LYKGFTPECGGLRVYWRPQHAVLARAGRDLKNLWQGNDPKPGMDRKRPGAMPPAGHGLGEVARRGRSRPAGGSASNHGRLTEFHKDYRLIEVVHDFR